MDKDSVSSEFVRVPLCATCAHLLENENWGVPGFVCKAFPGGIPGEIVHGLAIHTEPYQGDNGIQYEKAGEIGAGV